MGENGWLLIKHNDEFATMKDITKKDKSVLSGKTIEADGKNSEKVWQHGARGRCRESQSREVKKKPWRSTLRKWWVNELAEGQVDTAVLM